MNSWIIVFVGSWKGDSFRELHGAITNHFDLDAVWIELSTTPRVLVKPSVRLMETNHLSTNQIAAKVSIGLHHCYEAKTHKPAFKFAGIRKFMSPLLALMSHVVAHFPGEKGVGPSSYSPFSQILTKEFSVGGSGVR